MTVRVDRAVRAGPGTAEGSRHSMETEAPPSGPSIESSSMSDSRGSDTSRVKPPAGLPPLGTSGDYAVERARVAGPWATQQHPSPYSVGQVDSGLSEPRQKAATRHRKPRPNLGRFPRFRDLWISVFVIVAIFAAIALPFVLFVNTSGIGGNIARSGPATNLLIECQSPQTSQNGLCASWTLIGTDANLEIFLAAETTGSCSLESLQVFSPYQLVSVSPALPQPFGAENATGSIAAHVIHLTVQVPWVAGTYSVDAAFSVSCA